MYVYSCVLQYLCKFRHNKNKRSFDVAFLAGTQGDTSDNEAFLDINCDEENKRSFNEDTSSSKLNQGNGILNEDCLKSAFRKVNQQQSSLMPTIKQLGTINGRNVGCSKHLDIETAVEEETKTGKTNNSDNNNIPIEDKDNGTNCLISHRGDIQSIEHRVT